MKPYQSIWLSPRLTFEELAAAKDSQSLLGIPIFVVGISAGLSSSNDLANTLGDQDLVSILFGIILSTAFAFLIFGFLFPGTIKLFGLIWNGPATLTQLTNVLSISFIPHILILIHQIFLIVFGIEPTFTNIYGGLIYVVWLWSFALTIIGVSKVQKFSYGFALLNILLSQLPYLLVRLALRN